MLLSVVLQMFLQNCIPLLKSCPFQKTIERTLSRPIIQVSASPLPMSQCFWWWSTYEFLQTNKQTGIRPSRDPSKRPSAVPSFDPSSRYVQYIRHPVQLLICTWCCRCSKLLWILTHFRPSRDPSNRPSNVPSNDPSNRWVECNSSPISRYPDAHDREADFTHYCTVNRKSSPISGQAATLRINLPTCHHVTRHPGECDSIRPPFLDFPMHMIVKLNLHIIVNPHPFQAKPRPFE